MASVEESNKAAIRRFYDEVINRGNIAVVDELMEPNFVHYGETLFPRIEGSAAIKAGVRGVIGGQFLSRPADNFSGQGFVCLEGLRA